MAVAEILAGIALVKKSAEIISKGLNAAQDMSSLASQVDDLFEGKKQLKHQERQERAVGKSPTQTIIDQKLADEHILEIKSFNHSQIWVLCVDRYYKAPKRSCP